MRLNHDCLRDILLCVEEHTGLRKSCSFVDVGLSGTSDFLGASYCLREYQILLQKKYENEQLIYHVRYCLDAALIKGSNNGNVIQINDLTPEGHELLAKIRDPERWPKVKKAVSSIKDYSLSALSSIAEGITSATINSYFFGVH